ncbi:hypothetical protein HDU76_009139, partial [Blyttiomyces sp. JEL0837]
MAENLPPSSSSAVVGCADSCISESNSNRTSVIDTHNDASIGDFRKSAIPSLEGVSDLMDEDRTVVLDEVIHEESSIGLDKPTETAEEESSAFVAWGGPYQYVEKLIENGNSLVDPVPVLEDLSNECGTIIPLPLPQVFPSLNCTGNINDILVMQNIVTSPISQEELSAIPMSKEELFDTLAHRFLHTIFIDVTDPSNPFSQINAGLPPIALPSGSHSMIPGGRKFAYFHRMRTILEQRAAEHLFHLKQQRQSPSPSASYSSTPSIHSWIDQEAGVELQMELAVAALRGVEVDVDGSANLSVGSASDDHHETLASDVDVHALSISEGGPHHDKGDVGNGFATVEILPTMEGFFAIPPTEEFSNVPLHGDETATSTNVSGEEALDNDGDTVMANDTAESASTTEVLFDAANIRRRRRPSTTQYTRQSRHHPFKCANNPSTSS